jgi:hypothetical protein
VAGIQSAIALVGVGKQVSQGTALANPVYAHGVKSGQVFSVDYSQDREDLTSAKRIAPHVNRDQVMGAQSFTTRVFPRSVGTWLIGALGAVGSTNDDGTYTHVFTPAEALPYLTLHGKYGASVARITDGKVDELGLSWSENESPELSISAMGTVITLGGTFTPSGQDDSLAPYMVSSGGTFKVDVDGGSPATAAIVGGELTIANNVEPIMLSGSVTPSDMFEGRHDFGVSFSLRPANLDDWRTVLTGSASGTTVSSAPIYGSFEFTFVQGATSLKIEAPRVAFVAEFPDANPSGGAAEITLEGLLVQPTNGTTPTLTATLVNTIASY